MARRSVTPIGAAPSKSLRKLCEIALAVAAAEVVAVESVASPPMANDSEVGAKGASNRPPKSAQKTNPWKTRCTLAAIGNLRKLKPHMDLVKHIISGRRKN